MRKAFIRLVILKVALIFVLAIMAAASETRAEIKGRSGQNWVLSKGETHGVKTGMTGYFWTNILSGGKTYPTNIAKFKVVKVNSASSYVTVTETSDGYSEKNFKWATFTADLKPPTNQSSEPKPQSGNRAAYARYLENALTRIRKGDDPGALKEVREALKIRESNQLRDLEEEILLRLAQAAQLQRKTPRSDRSGRSVSRDENKAPGFLGFEWIKVPAGKFDMGSDNGESDEKPVHSVYLDTFYISKYEVTFHQYDKFCDATGRTKPDDAGWGRGSRPVINVSWNDAEAFCGWLSEKVGKSVRLPTEAEWEKAARGGNRSRGYNYSGSNDVGSVAWYFVNAGGKTHPVGGKAANELGIHDMSGNVWEWCADFYDEKYYSGSPSRNPTGPSSGSHRVTRGGGWDYGANCCRSAFRSLVNPSFRRNNLGFRPVMEP